MKNRILYVILAISILVNIILVVQTKKLKPQFSNDTVLPIESDTINMEKNACSAYLNNFFCNNPIDCYFLKQINAEDTEVESEIDKAAYMKIWKEQYEKILGIIRVKCIYPEDREIFTKYHSFVETIYDNSEPAFVSVMLHNFNDSPKEPAKYSYGMGTDDELNMYKGIIYRNACVMFIPYLENDYAYPTEKELASYLEKYKSKS